MKSPTNKEKVAIYEEFLHKINMFVICADNEGVAELVQNADHWSYMHRVGNGEISDKKQQELINNVFWKLCDTPEADKRTKDRQKTWQYAQTSKKNCRVHE